MSVLIEGACVIVPRLVLEATTRWPVERFIASAVATNPSVRGAYADSNLVSVSFADVHEADRALAALNIGELASLAACDRAIVDPEVGPMAPCDWLEWVRHPSGYSYVWLTGSEPGELAAPAGWQPSPRRGPADVRAEPGRAGLLSSEGSVETWLDYTTGEVFTVHLDTTQELPMAAPNYDFTPEPMNDLYPLLSEAMEEMRYRYLQVTPDALRFTCYSDRSLYDLMLAADARRREIVVHCVLPTRVPPANIVAVTELVTRVNYGLRLGNFELEIDRGDVRFKVSVDVAEFLPTTGMVCRMVGMAMTICDIYQGAFQRVLYAGISPADAVREAENP